MLQFADFPVSLRAANFGQLFDILCLCVILYLVIILIRSVYALCTLGRRHNRATDIAKTNENIVKIADLFNISEAEWKNVAIKASVSIRSIRHGNRRQTYFYMDLRDDSGEITAVAYSNNENDSEKMQLHTIDENKTYIFTKFNLEKSNNKYTSIPNDEEIVLNNNSVIKICGNAPKFKWPLTPLKKACDDTKFYNIVGLCTGVTETEIVMDELNRQVTLVDESRNEVILNVWNQETSLFDELDLNFHPVFFVKDARIFKYRGRTSLSTSRYLRLLDPDDPRAAKIREAILQGSPSKNPPDRTVAQIAPYQRDGYPFCTPSNYTRKNRNYVKIADLSDNLIVRNNVTVVATVTMKSIWFRTDKTFVLDLRDDSGEILAFAADDFCVKYHNFIQKNKTYSITGFYLLQHNNYSTSIPHRKRLILNNDSEIKLCGCAPKFEWPLSPLTEVPGVPGRGEEECYFHAFGLCTSVTATELVKYVRNGRYLAFKHRRYVTLVDQLSRELVLEVKFAETEIFDALDLNTHPVFFVKDAAMSDDKYKGNPVLKTRFYIELLEPDDPRARRVTEALFPYG